MRKLGRLLQIAGLLVPPVSLVLRFGTVTLLASLAFAVCLFTIGRYVEGYAAEG